MACSSTIAMLCRELKRQGISSGVVDLSVWPTLHLQLADGERAFLLRGTDASTPAAAESMLRPYRQGAEIVFLDGGRLDDPAIEPWLPHCSHFILNMAPEPQSIAALPELWNGIERMRRSNPALQMLGILPVLVRGERQELLRKLRTRFAKEFLPMELQWSPGNEDAPAGGVELSRLLVRQFSLRPMVEPKTPATPKETGVLSKLWRKASSLLRGGTVSTERGATA